MRSKLGITFMTIGAVLVTAALSLAVYNIYMDREAGKKSSNVIINLEKKITQRSIENTNTYSAMISEAGQEPEPIAVNNSNYIGIIDIPVINIKLPVLSEWSYDNLKISPCRYIGSITDGGFIIAAHNYTSHFGKLKDLMYDDEIYFIDTNGKAHEFFVSEIEEINGEDADRMEKGNWPLTLFTCNFDGTERVTIRCEKIND